VKTIETAHASILVQAYSFTSAPIAKALVEAHTRGVKVNVILDRSNRTAHTPAADLLARAGIPTRIDPTRKIAHSRAMLIVDGEMVITAAFNIFGRAGGERNAEDLVMIRGKAEASVYTGQWREHAQGSVPYTPGQADK
jgi:phosphatidylserine/phosphatidylglycerophosphate/cardiolipin synthase-like enzyme